MEERKAVPDQEYDLLVRPIGETDEEYDARCERWRENELRKRQEEREKAAQVKSEQKPIEAPDDDDDDDEQPGAGDPAMPPSDPVAAQKAEREQQWAEAGEKDAQEEELRRHWEEARLAEVDSRGGLAPLKRGLPPADTGRWPLPRVPKPAGDRAPRYVRPDAPPDDAETELAAIIAECRYFMRAMVFESARMTPDAGDRFGFIDRACKLAEAGARVGKTVAGLRGREVPPPREHRQHITIDDRRRAAAEEGEGGA